MTLEMCKRDQWQMCEILRRCDSEVEAQRMVKSVFMLRANEKEQDDDHTADFG